MPDDVPTDHAAVAPADSLRRSPPTEETAALRRAILDATRSLLVRDGYNGLSMRKIAREVGCSATSIYLYFGSKDALTHALIAEGMERLHDALEAAEAGLTSPPERLAALSRAYVCFGMDHPEYYETMFQLHPERMARYPVAEYRRARRNVERFTSVLADGIADGSLRSVAAPPVAAAALWTALHGLVSLHLAERVDRRIAGPAFLDAAIAQATAAFRP